MKNPAFVEFISANGNLYLFLYTLQIKESILCELISGLFCSRCLWSSGHAPILRMRTPGPRPKQSAYR